MKVGDLVKFKNKTAVRGNVFLVVRTEAAAAIAAQKVWIYPDPDGGSQPYAFNFYYDHFFEVISESG